MVSVLHSCEVRLLCLKPRLKLRPGQVNGNSLRIMRLRPLIMKLIVRSSTTCVLRIWLVVMQFTGAPVGVQRVCGRLLSVAQAETASAPTSNVS